MKHAQYVIQKLLSQTSVLQGHNCSPPYQLPAAMGEGSALQPMSAMLAITVALALTPTAALEARPRRGDLCAATKYVNCGGGHDLVPLKTAPKVASVRQWWQPPRILKATPPPPVRRRGAVLLRAPRALWSRVRSACPARGGRRLFSLSWVPPQLCPLPLLYYILN